MGIIYKKSQGLPINVIILAVLGLAVLIVLIIIFSSQTGKNVSILESCAGKAGNCRDKGCLEGEIQTTIGKCSPDTKVCCIKIYEDKK